MSGNEPELDKCNRLRPSRDVVRLGRETAFLADRLISSLNDGCPSPLSTPNTSTSSLTQPSRLELSSSSLNQPTRQQSSPCQLYPGCRKLTPGRVSDRMLKSHSTLKFGDDVCTEYLYSYNVKLSGPGDEPLAVCRTPLSVVKRTRRSCSECTPLRRDESPEKLARRSLSLRHSNKSRSPTEDNETWVASLFGGRDEGGDSSANDPRKKSSQEKSEGHGQDTQYRATGGVKTPERSQTQQRKARSPYHRSPRHKYTTPSRSSPRRSPRQRAVSPQSLRQLQDSAKATIAHLFLDSGHLSPEGGFGNVPWSSSQLLARLHERNTANHNSSPQVSAARGDQSLKTEEGVRDETWGWLLKHPEQEPVVDNLEKDKQTDVDTGVAIDVPKTPKHRQGTLVRIRQGLYKFYGQIIRSDNVSHDQDSGVESEKNINSNAGNGASNSSMHNKSSAAGKPKTSKRWRRLFRNPFSRCKKYEVETASREASRGEREIQGTSFIADINNDKVAVRIKSKL